MKKILIILLILSLCAVTLPGCGSSKDGYSAIQNDNGDQIKIGMKKKDVDKLFDEKPDAANEILEQAGLDETSNGLYLYGSDLGITYENGVIIQIYASSYKWVTPLNVGLGDLREDIKKSYDMKESETNTVLEKSDSIYISKDLNNESFSIMFSFDDENSPDVISSVIIKKK